MMVESIYMQTNVIFRFTDIIINSALGKNIRVQSAPQNGHWCVWPVATLRAERPPKSGSRLRFNHNCIVFRCSFQDGIGRHLVVENHGVPAFWWTSNTVAVKMTLTKERLIRFGFYDLAVAYQSVHVNYWNRRVPNGTHGGVRGRRLITASYSIILYIRGNFIMVAPRSILLWSPSS